ncbi:histidine kinase [Nitratireductor aestuarii]|nr:histidine kinase [Nitratireductor aestuarii]
MPDKLERYPTGERLVSQSTQQDEAQGPLIDLDHLAGQTLYDIALQNEVLALFHQQLLEARSAVLSMNSDQRRDLAHRLVGAARAVGAFSLALTVEAVSNDPQDTEILARMRAQIDSLIPHLVHLITSEERAKG